MIFDKKFEDKKRSQIKTIVNEVVTEAFRQQSQAFVQQQDAQTTFLREMAEKNQKSIRNLSDTVEDFLDTLQEKEEEQQQSQQNLQEVKKREQNLLELLGLYQQQMELFEQWITGQDETNEVAREAWKQQYSMLKRKILTESRLCAIQQIGVAGEPVDYRLHEVLEAVDPELSEQEGTVAKVYSQGMIYQGTVIRKAKIAAYRKA